MPEVKFACRFSTTGLKKRCRNVSRVKGVRGAEVLAALHHDERREPAGLVRSRRGGRGRGVLRYPEAPGPVEDRLAGLNAAATSSDERL